MVPESGAGEALPPLNTILADCESTQSLARAWAERGAPHGSWVSARTQRAGRGRYERTWVSPTGNLYLSLVVRGIPTSLWTWIPLAAAVAVRRSALDLLVGGWDTRITIKWPNDVMVDGAKAGGILCESSLGGSLDRCFVIVGIGVNCAEAPSVPDRPTARFGVSADALRSGVVLSLLQVLGDLVEPLGVERLSREFESCSQLPSGSICRWREESGEVREGTVLGLGAHGELRVRVLGNSASEERQLTSEEVSLGAALNRE